MELSHDRKPEKKMDNRIGHHLNTAPWHLNYNARHPETDACGINQRIWHGNVVGGRAGDE